MAFISEDDIFQKWKYHVEEFKLLLDSGEEQDIPPFRIQSITILHDYEINLFPIFRIEAALEPSVYYKIIKNKQKIKFKIRIQKYYTEIGSDEKSLYRDYINDTFDLILDDDDYDPDEGIRKEEQIQNFEEISTDTTNDLFNTNNLIELFLFKSEYVESGNIGVNEILSNATVSDGIQYIASMSNMKKILMTPSDNNTVIPELIIPPLKSKEAILWLDTYYGIYKNGILFYIDMISGITYLLSYSGDCTAYQKKEIKETDIMIPEKSGRYSSDVCSLKRKGVSDINFIIGDNKNLSSRNESISYNEYADLQTTTTDSYTGESTTDIGKGNTKNNKTSKFLINNTENKWYSKRYVSLISGKRIVIQLTLADYDISALAPNKKYKFLFEDSALAKKYKGNYRLGNISHYFVKEGTDFTINTVATFKQVD